MSQTPSAKPPAKKAPPKLELQSQQAPNPEPTPTELTIRSTTRPIIGKPSVKNRVGKPMIGARSLVRTPGINRFQVTTSEPNT